MSDPFGYWPEGSAYRTPEPETKPLAFCKACHQRHLGPTPRCELTNEGPEDDGPED